MPYVANCHPNKPQSYAIPLPCDTPEAALSWHLSKRLDDAPFRIENSEDWVMPYANLITRFTHHFQMLPDIFGFCTETTHRTSYRVAGSLWIAEERKAQDFCLVFPLDKDVRNFTVKFRGGNYLARKHGLYATLVELALSILERLPLAWEFSAPPIITERKRCVRVASETFNHSPDFNAPHRYKAWALIDVYGAVVLTFDENAQEALDAFADSGELDYVKVDERDVERERAQHGDSAEEMNGWTVAGNFGYCYDMAYVYLQEAVIFWPADYIVPEATVLDPVDD